MFGSGFSLEGSFCILAMDFEMPTLHTLSYSMES